MPISWIENEPSPLPDRLTAAGGVAGISTPMAVNTLAVNKASIPGRGNRVSVWLIWSDLNFMGEFNRVESGFAGCQLGRGGVGVIGTFRFVRDSPLLGSD